MAHISENALATLLRTPHNAYTPMPAQSGNQWAQARRFVMHATLRARDEPPVVRLVIG
jgi:hypothetical protein